MDGWKRRAIGYFVLVAFALLLTAAGYQYGMHVWEGRPRTFLDSLQFAVEMFTTTGFGGDAPWTSPEMQLFITITDLVGMALLVGALPVLVGPLLENALSTTAPSSLESDLTDHVIICSDSTRTQELITELDAQYVPYVIVESDRKRANELYEEGHRVVRADPESAEGLEAARLSQARALFADITDKVDASIVLTAKEVTEDVPVVSVVEDPERAKYHRLAGAEHVLLPRQLLGESLAQKVTTAIQSDIQEAVKIDESLELAEVSIRHGSDLARKTLAEGNIREETGVNVIGAWFQGTFDASPSPESTLTPGTVLLVSGRSDQLQQLVEMTQSSVREFEAGETVVVGYGHVGQTVAATLDEMGLPYTVMDHSEMDGVDIVGDATQEETLAAAGIDDAQTVVLALPDDTMTEFATLVIRDMAPEIEIVARVEEKANISKTYRAGADYVLSLETVTGRMSASYLLESEDILSLDQQMKIARTSADVITGLAIEEANIREQTGCTVIAIERGGDLLTDIEPGTVIRQTDTLIIVGTDEGVREFERLFT